MKLTKNNLKQNQNHKEKRKKSKTLWITIVIHGAICVVKQ